MKKTTVSKLALSLSLCAALTLACVPSACASTPNANIQVMPRSETINFATSHLTDLGGGSLNVYVSADGAAKVEEIDVVTTLQKKTLLWWSDVETFNETAYSNVILLDEDTTVDAGTYRLHSEFTFISDITETHSHYSNQVTIK